MPLPLAFSHASEESISDSSVVRKAVTNPTVSSTPQPRFHVNHGTEDVLCYLVWFENFLAWHILVFVLRFHVRECWDHQGQVTEAATCWALRPEGPHLVTIPVFTCVAWVIARWWCGMRGVLCAGEQCGVVVGVLGPVFKLSLMGARMLPSAFVGVLCSGVTLMHS